jgi:hypothetical protein
MAGRMNGIMPRRTQIPSAVFAAAILLFSLCTGIEPMRDGFDPLDFVDPLIGTLNGGGYIHNFPVRSTVEVSHSEHALQDMSFPEPRFHSGWQRPWPTSTQKIRVDSLQMTARSQDLVTCMILGQVSGIVFYLSDLECNIEADKDLIFNRGHQV